ncbi:MAG: DNA-3-methyladenine glycosylase 2 family protein [Blastocatellia bacterium]|nr:MAG: DNA-3-methyladenine glycosylase 2 family protein [Blastocatellia bacterium]
MKSNGQQTQSNILTNSSLRSAAADLAKRDKHLALIFTNYGPPPLWRRNANFSTLVQIILEQQVSLKSAAAIFRRLADAIQPFEPEHIRRRGEVHLRSLGLTRQKASYLVNLANAVADGELNLKRLTRLTDDAARLELMSIKGIGLWSADVYLLMAMRRADIWPSGDLALAAAITELMGLEKRPDAGELQNLAESWRPHRAVAARMLWQYYLAKRGRL